MTEQDLLQRVEEQAAEIAGLKKALAEVEAELKHAVAKQAAVRKAIYQELARAAVNCNGRSSCALAGRADG